MLAPDTSAVLVIAARIVQRFAEPPSCDGIDKLCQEGGPVERSEFAPGVCPAEPVQGPAAQALVCQFVQAAIGDTCSQHGPKVAAPERPISSSGEDALSGELSGAKRISHAESGQRVLESGLLANNGALALHRGARNPYIAEPAKRGGWRLVDGLMEQILEDAGQEPGRLPLRLCH